MVKVVRAAPALAGIRRSTATAEPEKQHQHQKQQIAHTGLLACLAAGPAGTESGVGFLGASTPGMADGRTVGTVHVIDLEGSGSALASRAGIAVGREDTLARVHRLAV